MIVPITLYQTFPKSEVELWHVVGNLHWSSSSVRINAVHWKPYNGAPPSRQAWHGAPGWSYCAPMAIRWPRWPDAWRWLRVWWPNGSHAIDSMVPKDWAIHPDRDDPRSFPPKVALHVIKVACERPETRGRSLSQWDSAELARDLVRTGVVDAISSATVRRILHHHKLKPWRHHMWLSPKHPRDAAFYERITELIDLYTRPLQPEEIVLSVDEKTSLQPRPRLHPTTPAQPGRPNRVAHEYRRDGALNLFAAFNTRTGHVFGQCYGRKRQREFIAFLEGLDSEIAQAITTIHIVCDNVSVHHGKEVQKWLQAHPRFVLHFTPVHCSWMNQVEQWFSILQRKRFRIVDFESKVVLEAKIGQFIAEWNQKAHPFNWSTKSVAKIMAEAPAKVA